MNARTERFEQERKSYMNYALVHLVSDRDLGKGQRASAATRKAVMMALARFADADGGGIWASVATIAKVAGLKERSAHICLAEFDEEGLTCIEGKRGQRRGATVIRRLNVDGIKRFPLVFERDGDVTVTGETLHDVPPYPARRAVHTLHDVQTNTTSEDYHEEKGYVLTNIAATDAAAACSASPIDRERGAAKAETLDEWLGTGGLPQFLADTCEGFEDVISPQITEAEWRSDLVDLMELGAYDLDTIANATRSFFQTHRRRASRDARWELLRRPLRHPVVRQRIMAEVEGQFCGDWGAGHRGRRAIRTSAGPSPGRQHGRSERGTSPAWKNPRNSGPWSAETAAAGANCAERNVANIERFELTPDSPIFEVWGALPAQKRAA